MARPFLFQQKNNMANYKKEYWNNQKTKCVIITRSKLSDGYNYYIMLLNKGTFGGMVINNSYKQKEILSEKQAIQTAKNLIK